MRWLPLRLGPVALAVALLASAPGCVGHVTTRDDLARIVELSAPTPGDLVTTFFETGLGDAILLELPSGKTMLVDAGMGFHVQQILDYLAVRDIHRLDVLLLTHPHDDHYGGMLRVIEHVPVGTFVYNGVTTSAPLYERLMQRLDEKHIPKRIVRRGDRLDKLLGPGCTIDVLYPDAPALTLMRFDLNQTSIALDVKHGTQRLLLMGDCEELEERRLLALHKDDDLHADVLKLGHHATHDSSTPPWLETVRPWLTIAMGTEGLNFPPLYTHPHEAIVDELRRMRVPLLMTGEHGPIQVVSTGTNVRATTLRGRFVRSVGDPHRPDAAARLAALRPGQP